MFKIGDVCYIVEFEADSWHNIYRNIKLYTATVTKISAKYGRPSYNPRLPKDKDKFFKFWTLDLLKRNLIWMETRNNEAIDKIIRKKLLQSYELAFLGVKEDSNTVQELRKVLGIPENQFLTLFEEFKQGLG
jgi:hypothetical protein